MEERFQCTRCKSLFEESGDYAPLVLPCGHSCCKGCSGKPCLRCPHFSLQKTVSQPQLPKNRALIEEMLERKRENHLNSLLKAARGCKESAHFTFKELKAMKVMVDSLLEEENARRQEAMKKLEEEKLALEEEVREKNIRIETIKKKLKQLTEDDEKNEESHEDKEEFEFIGLGSYVFNFDQWDD